MKTCAALFALALCTLAPTRALAAESYDNCTGFIESLPVTIGTQGTWCLRRDLATAMTSGAAIAVATNNVTLDCNGFKIGGLAAGVSTNTFGISAAGPHNLTVRNCSLRGFLTGIMITAGSGHLIEDNRLDNMTATGILVGGEDSLVRRNRVFDTGGRPGSGVATGMTVSGDIIENTVSGVFADGDAPNLAGVRASGPGARVRGNTVRGLVSTAGAFAVGIDGLEAELQLEDNNIVSLSDINGVGIWGTVGSVCTGNKVFNYSSAMPACTDGGGNVTH